MGNDKDLEEYERDYLERLKTIMTFVQNVDIKKMKLNENLRDL